MITSFFSRCGRERRSTHQTPGPARTPTIPLPLRFSALDRHATLLSKSGDSGHHGQALAFATFASLSARLRTLRCHKLGYPD